MAIADLKNNSPNAAQSQNVNVFVNTPQPTEPDQTVNYQTQENPYSEITQPPKCITRDIETAITKTEELSSNIDEKENVIKALSLIIDVIQNNPLVVNKYVVAETETLADIEEVYDDGTPVKWQIANVSGANNRTKGSVIASGSVIVQTLTMNGPNKQNADYTAQLQGYGAYTVGS